VANERAWVTSLSCFTASVCRSWVQQRPKDELLLLNWKHKDRDFYLGENDLLIRVSHHFDGVGGSAADITFSFTSADEFT
jgi:hypothetical protein